MSAYIVEDKTINKIVGALYYHGRYGRIYPNPAYGSEILTVCTKEKAEKLAQDLLDLNYKSVNARYREQEEPHTIAYKNTTPASKVRLHKALSCFLYQSCEGNCANTELYKQVENYKNRLADDIVHNLEEWDNAPWG